jgi:hypothetical protein
MPIQRSISRVVTPGPPVAGCRKVGHTFIEVIHADDFISADPFIRLTDDRLEIGNRRSVLCVLRSAFLTVSIDSKLR